MNVLFVSECSKNALPETRRILDQFAERFGSRTWQTHITQQGLHTIKKLLKRTARRNSAIACHWIRGKDRTDLLWIVGNASQFNENGMVPTNTTTTDVLRRKDENDWHTLQDIQILTSIGALFHDFGKASLGFQKKLTGNKKVVADAYRHEWVSLRLFEAFVTKAKGIDENGLAKDSAWLTLLSNIGKGESTDDIRAYFDILITDGKEDQSAESPFRTLPPLAQAIGWLMLTHHQLPKQQWNNTDSRSQKPRFNPKRLNLLLGQLGPEWNSSRTDASKEEKVPFWEFKHLPIESTHWQARARYIADVALKRPNLLTTPWLENIYTLHLARLGLMLADHYYSSLPEHPELGDAGFPLFANTDPLTGKKKQRLDEHLLGVENNARKIIQTLPLLERSLPRIARHKGFKLRSEDVRYRWQDNAYDLACSIREKAAANGFFGVNMASTGCGKTFGNARIMYGLADPMKGARFTIALGLRTLTLQTGEAYRTRLGLESDDLAVMVGSTAVKALFNLGSDTKDELKIQANGSESSESLLPIDYSYVHFDGTLDIGPLSHWIQNTPHAQSLIAAPILTCTIDHLMGATEATKGGRQIAPMLRLMSSDLVLDEPDDFDIADLPALSRLVHWAGLLGCKILLSSATLPPSLVEGLFRAYSAGRMQYQKARGNPEHPVNICCAWFDEHNNSATASYHQESSNFRQAHDEFVTARLKKLQAAPIRRRAVIIPITSISQSKKDIRNDVAKELNTLLHQLHKSHHSIDPHTKKQVSFGLIRFANIDPLIDIAQKLFSLGAEQNQQIRLCCYHSHHPLLVRSAIESSLDRLLDRKDPEKVFGDPLLRKMINETKEENLLIVVLATPVAEVGRDHDYDWAIVEPSSMRSIIQLAGRVKRHRMEPCDTPNIFLLSTNIKSLERPHGEPSYCHPGFETKSYPLNTHELEHLLNPEQYSEINALPRILSKETLSPKDNLADLEHARLQSLMLGQGAMTEIPVQIWWDTQAMLAGEWQRETPFRYDSLGRQKFGLLPDEYDDSICFYDLDGEKPKANDGLFQRINLNIGERIRPFIEDDYLTMVDSLANRFSMEQRECALRFGWVDLPIRGAEQGWRYHHVLGIRRYNE
ncbi:MAG: type I-F CRISPR-associated helicase Cas3 [Chlorobium sp.]|nr:MAG: type I-F CRISPR-associated helicase Cas3 [Chlorobium sp.]